MRWNHEKLIIIKSPSLTHFNARKRIFFVRINRSRRLFLVVLNMFYWQVLCYLTEIIATTYKSKSTRKLTTFIFYFDAFTQDFISGDHWKLEKRYLQTCLRPKTTSLLIQNRKRWQLFSKQRNIFFVFNYLLGLYFTNI